LTGFAESRYRIVRRRTTSEDQQQGHWYQQQVTGYSHRHSTVLFEKEY